MLHGANMKMKHVHRLDANTKVNCDLAIFGLDAMNDEIKNRACMNDTCTNASASRHRNLKRNYCCFRQ